MCIKYNNNIHISDYKPAVICMKANCGCHMEKYVVCIAYGLAYISYICIYTNNDCSCP